MARFRTEGLDSLIDSMNAMEQDTEDLAERMLFAGAEEVKKAWKQAADKHHVRLTDQTYNSIGFPRKPKRARDLISIDIYPQGMSTYTISKGKKVMRKKPVRNAEVAYVNNYGTSDKPGTFFVDTADDLSGPLVEEACTGIYDKWLEEHGMK